MIGLKNRKQNSIFLSFNLQKNFFVIFPRLTFFLLEFINNFSMGQIIESDLYYLKTPILL